MNLPPGETIDQARSTWFGGWRRTSLRTWLVAIILAATLPLSALVVYQIVRDVGQQRRAVDSNLQSLATALAAAVDREVTASIDALTLLSHLEPVGTGDLPAFRQLLQGGDLLRPSWSSVFVARPDGSTLFDVSPAGNFDPRLSVGSWEGWPEPAAQRPGKAFLATVAGRAEGEPRQTIVAVPMSTTSGQHLVIGAGIAIGTWQTLLQRGGVETGGVATLFDANQLVIARSRDAARFAGNTLAASALPGNSGAASGVRQVRLPDGAEATAAWQRIEHGPWHVAVALPMDIADAANSRAVLVALGTAAACLLLGVTAAMLLARRVTAPIALLASGLPAHRLGPIAVEEIARLRDALLSFEQERSVSLGRLSRKAEEFETLFQSSPLGLAFAQDAQASTVLQNAAMDRLLPCDGTREPTSGRVEVLSDGALLKPDDQPLQRAARTGEVVAPMELELRSAGRAPRFVLAGAKPLHDADGRPRGAIAATVDITARKQAEAELLASRSQERKAREEAEAANRTKDEFLGMLGHELRNPMNAITTAVEVLNRLEPGEPAAASARNIIGRQTRKLSQMVAELLDVGRVMGDRVELLRQPLDLGALLRRIVTSAQPAAVAKGQWLHFHSVEAWVNADAQRIGQVIEHLLDNAQRHSPVGASIEARLTHDRDQVVLQVSDSGEGIAPALLERVFEPFVQAGQAIDRRDGGLGLGLTLVRRLVQLHGGVVHASSSGAGAMFDVRLPSIPPPGISAVATSALSTGAGLSRVAIIEDNDDAMSSLRAILEIDGHAVQTAGNGEHGLALLLREQPDIAIVDLGLPGIDGFEVARRSRAQGFHGRLIALSGYGQPQDVERSMAAGFDAHLIKPLKTEELQKLLSRA